MIQLHKKGDTFSKGVTFKRSQRFI